MCMLHRPVMLDELIVGLSIQSDGCYVDGTFGRGGHSRCVLEKLGPQGCLICIDKDPEAIEVAQQPPFNDRRVHVAHQSFSEMRSVLSDLNLMGRVNGIYIDLGVSSPQIDQASRGFSFNKSGP